MPSWTVNDSNDLYNIPHWGAGYFGVNEQGEIVVTPDGPEGPKVSLFALTQELVERGIEMPILLRFPDIVRKRVDNMAGIFRTAITEYEYQGRYRGVYPIKVNQQAHLVRDLVGFCRPHHMGLEAGSKPELLVCLALLDDPEALIICNGYKDEEYIATALLARRLGRQTIIVIEKLGELDTILEVAERLEIRPVLGVRARLSRPGKGRWESSSGDKAKFGLNARGIVEVVERLRAAEMLDCLQLLHFHIGSQVTAIHTFRSALREGTRIYVEMKRMGAAMGLFDVGGGLGVDYDGSRTNFDSSKNYSDQEYAYDVINAISNACDAAEVPHPDIVTEAGRAMVAHSSVLIVDVVGVEQLPTGGEPAPVDEEAPTPLYELREVYENVNARNYQEAWHDAQHAREEGLMAFNMGLMTLEQRAELEQLYWQVCGRVRHIARKQSYVPDDLDDLERKLADTYYCNFSVFQSAPDAWAIGQLFPCAPIHRLTEEPTRRAILADLTCDSDGKVDRFIDRRDVKDVLELHAWDGSPYFVGLFLVGAYQEILGDLHNLFGDTNAVHVTVQGNDEYRIDLVLEGDSVSEVLGYVHFSARELVRKVREACEDGIRTGAITRKDARLLMRSYQRGLEGYTYLNQDP